jgi:hypothetical protein
MCVPSDPHQPYWSDYRDLLERLDRPGFPSAESLNRLLPAGAVSGGDQPIRFVPASRLPGVAYERHIYETGEVSTREDNRHDLFNALVWCRFPRLKASLNRLHYENLAREDKGCRGPQRDALTLLDESGAIVVSRDLALLEALAARDWALAFTALQETWQRDSRTVICGHALLEKLTAPYKSITAHALLLYVEPPGSFMQAGEFLERLDQGLGTALLRGLCKSPSNLSPLPLMGIPGWWAGGSQDSTFYDDPSVFRAAPADLSSAVIHPF